MKYMLILLILGEGQQVYQIGPFSNVFACEQAVNQTKTLHRAVRSTCVNLDAKPHHWNGKALPK